MLDPVLPKETLLSRGRGLAGLPPNHGGGQKNEKESGKREARTRIRQECVYNRTQSRCVYPRSALEPDGLGHSNPKPRSIEKKQHDLKGNPLSYSFSVSLVRP